MMKRSRQWWALLFLLGALVLLLAAGFYLGVTHQEPRPQDASLAMPSPPR